jgi:serine/threonine protein kinase
MAELFLARATGAHGFEKTVVIKCILPHLALDDHFKEMFISEAKITAALSHPKIAQTYELGQCDNRLYIAMEFVDGLDVLAMLRECAHRRQRIPNHISIYILREVLDALDFAHHQSGRVGGVVHRDISPSNVLVSRRGGVKLVDFGIAHAAVRDHQTRAGALKGKYGYMAPEQITGSGVSALSDLFSVGVVMSEMLMGRRLFAAPNELDVLLMVRDVDLSRLERLGSHIDAGLQTIIRKALQKTPSDRFASAAQFRDVLDQWLFDHRIQVTNTHIAEFVEAMYKDADDRRRQQLAKTLSELPAETKQSIHSAETQNNSMPTAVGTPSEVKTKPAAPMSAPLPAAPAPAPAKEPSEPIDLQTTRRMPRSSATPVKHEPIPGEYSDSYPSISAAVASLAPQDADPAAKDFDGSDIASRSGSRSRPHSITQPNRRKRASSADPVKAAATRAAPLEMSDPSVPATEQGDLSRESALAVIYRRAAHKQTGLLTVSVGGIKKEVYFRNGIPEYVSSNVAGELFGAYLVGQEVITGGELDMALAMMPHYGGKLGDTLVGLGLMKPLEVFGHLTRQVREKVIDVCTWHRGSYSWYHGMENHRDSFRLDIDPYEILGAGSASLNWDFLKNWLRIVAEQKPRAVVNTRVSPDDFKLGGSLGELQKKLDGKKTVAILCRRYTSREGQVRLLRHLYLLLHTDLARF